MGIGSFLFGSSGGVPKNIRNLLMKEFQAESGEIDPAFLEYINAQIDPAINRERGRIASQYASADAPIVSGGRTQANIALAGEASQQKLGAVLSERERRKRRRQELLSLLTSATYKQPSQGFLGGLADSVSFTKAI